MKSPKRVAPPTVLQASDLEAVVSVFDPERPEPPGPFRKALAAAVRTVAQAHHSYGLSRAYFSGLGADVDVEVRCAACSGGLLACEAIEPPVPGVDRAH